MRRIFLVLSLCIASGALAAPAVARTETLACGAVVTHSVRLAADVQCPFGVPAGLLVGADGITIDLNGHQVLAQSQAGGGIGSGIENDGHGHVTIRNGAINGFAWGVRLNGASDNRLVGLSRTFGLTTGIEIDGGAWNLVSHSSVFGRGWGIVVDGSDHVRLIANTPVGASSAVAISLEADYGVIAKNVMNEQFNRAGGVMVSGSFNRIARNAVVGAEGAFMGIQVTSGQGNVIARNWVVNGSGDGVLTAPQATNTLIIWNVATGNRADGIDVKGASASILFNRAYNNHNYGIEAVPGVLAFRNTASGNGNPMQCLNVTCN